MLAHIKENTGQILKLFVLTGVLFFGIQFSYAQDSAKVEVPNVFTPNGDGINDVFRPKYTNIEKVDGAIYNRWGEIIFRWWGVNGYWDGVTFPAGQKVPAGTYYYIITATSYSKNSITKTGTVQLFR